MTDAAGKLGAKPIDESQNPNSPHASPAGAPALQPEQGPLQGPGIASPGQPPVTPPPSDLLAAASAAMASTNPAGLNGIKRRGPGRPRNSERNLNGTENGNE
ncbi:hypothetical protein SSBR45G_19450 [Bradyrhizobium sp. SSBR45G]|nr:hypothetical protein SSBR45G_19450 [Bradyrhizobium sp. SSBR45G]GLH83795.1 hypothetical protein SSBR45R_12550 [Bradyrhizobium sp. SSBR45R]